jgi:hypothetical protein
MAKDDVARLAVLIEANTKSYENAMIRLEKKTGKAMRASSKSVRTLDNRMKVLQAGAIKTASTFARVFGAGVLTAGLFGISGAIGEVIAGASRLADAADKVGLTTEALQRLRFAAEQGGVATRTMDMAMQRFSRRVGEAAQGKGELVQTLKKYNVEVRDTNGNVRDQVEILKDLADRIRDAGSDQERLAIAFKAFDSEGAALVNTLRGGAEALGEVMGQANILADEQIRNAKRLDDEWTAFATNMSTNVRGSILSVVSLISGLSEQLKGLADKSTATLEADLARLQGLRAQFGGPGAGVTDLEIETQAELERRRAAGGGDISVGSLGGLNGPITAPESEVGGGVTKQIDSAKQLIEALELEISLIGKSAVEVEKLNALRAAGTDATEAQKAAILALIETKNAETDANKKLISMQAELEAGYERAGAAIGSVMGDIVSGAKTAEEAMKDLLQQLSLVAAKQALLGIIDNAGMEDNALIKGILNGLGIVGKRASGGPVAAGRPYVVGERGPEMFVPNISGKIVPNAANGNGGGPGAAGGRLDVRVISEVRNGNLVPVMTEISGQVAGQAIRQSVPGMIDTQAPVATAAASRSFRL